MLTIKFDESAFNKAMDEVEKQVKFATMVALNRTASIVKKEAQEEMRSVFDRPTPFTLNSLTIQKATKANLEAKVWFKTPTNVGEFKTLGRREHYLTPQVYGGSRHFKNFEAGLYLAGVLPRGWYAVPGASARKNVYGNQSQGQIVQILSAVKAFGEVGYLMNRSSRKGAKVTKSNRINYVIIKPGPNPQNRAPGIYVRSGNSFKQVLSFVRTVGYRKRFDFFGLSNRVTQREMQNQFSKTLTEARASAR